MSRAIKPDAMPPLPAGMVEWRRSSRRGSVFHAHAIGLAACGRIRLDRFRSEGPRDLGDLQYWGVCPRCYAKAMKDSQ